MIGTRAWVGAPGAPAILSGRFRGPSIGERGVGSRRPVGAALAGCSGTILRGRSIAIGALALFCLTGVPACRDQRSGDRSVSGGDGARAGPAPSARGSRQGVRALVSEAHRAELSAGGLFIDFGTGDQHKYTQGGWRNGWGRRDSDSDGTTFAAAAGRSVPVRLYLEATHLPVRDLVLRLRARPRDRMLSVLLDGKPLGGGRVPDRWTTVRLRVPAGEIPTGWHDLRLLFDGPPGPARAEVDWLWLASDRTTLPEKAIPRVAPLSLGGRTRRALLAPTPRTFAFHLQPLPGVALVFDFGSESDTLFTIYARPDGGARQQLFQDRAQPGAWREGVIDLGAFADRAVRLELETSGYGSAGWGEPEIMRPRAAAAKPLARVTRPRNVIVLVMDTARADVFSPFNAGTRVKTPALDRLARSSAVFRNAYTNENWTKPSVATILSGLYPSTHGAKREPDVLNAAVALLPEILSRRGFSTAAFIANGYCSDKFGFQRGWSFYRNYIRENRPSQAEHVFSDALAWLERNRARPFFLYLQTIDPHVTYAPPADQLRMYHPEPYRGPLGPTLDGFEQAAISQGKRKVSAADVRWMRALYDGEISYHDLHLGRFLRGLAGADLLDETLLVITNDHGEEIGDHGRHGHGHTLYQELIRSPLLMRHPPLFPAGPVEEVVEMVDLTPTIVEALGLPAQPDLDGVSLLPTLGGRPPGIPSYALSEFLDDQRALMVGRWKLLAGVAGWRKLFDLQVDPEEKADLASQAPIARRLCEQHLGEALATPDKAARLRDVRSSPRRFQTSRVDYDPELRRQLEALGYVGAM
jgi:choline-sulfatase